jgi:hypothetical protein
MVEQRHNMPILLKLGINSQFVVHYQLSRNSFPLIEGQTRSPMKAITTIILMLLPISFGAWAYAFPEVGPVPMRIAVWSCMSVICLIWGFLIRRKHRALGWCCIVVCCLQAVVFLLPAFMPPGKTRTSTVIIHPRNWSNERAGGDGGIPPAFYTGRGWPALPEHGC